MEIIGSQIIRNQTIIGQTITNQAITAQTTIIWVIKGTALIKSEVTFKIENNKSLISETASNPMRNKEENPYKKHLIYYLIFYFL